MSVPACIGVWVRPYTCASVPVRQFSLKSHISHSSMYQLVERHTPKAVLHCHLTSCVALVHTASHSCTVIHMSPAHLPQWPTRWQWQRRRMSCQISTSFPPGRHQQQSGWHQLHGSRGRTKQGIPLHKQNKTTTTTATTTTTRSLWKPRKCCYSNQWMPCIQ